MSKPQYTPEPWAYDEDDARIYYADDDVEPTIAYVEREDIAPERVRADGYLLSSAAALFTEAKANVDCFEFLEEQLNVCIDNFSDWQTKDTKRFLADLREAVSKRISNTGAAIVKATGGVNA